jgi:Flp pilus assembly pilin Flp
MRRAWRNLWNDENGSIISAELVLVLTILVLGLSVGLSALGTAVNSELEDLAEAFGAVDQSYFFNGARVCTARTSGSSFNDKPDHCDCIPIDTCTHEHILAPDKCE